VPPQRIGVATSMATFARQMGSTVGLAIVGTIFATVLATRINEEMGNATARVPAEFRQQIAAMQGGAGAAAEGGEGMDTGTGTFDAEKLKARVHQGFVERRRALENLPPDDPRRQALAGMEMGEKKAMGLVDDLALAMKEAFTDAIRTIYQASVLIAVLGLLISLVAPEVPLRGPGGPPRPVAE
ncbi:MAG TPA: MFS transporter, partial [Myxococcales bacterium]|nr:MFS transporter [Myxococcales bacterium]